MKRIFYLVAGLSALACGGREPITASSATARSPGARPVLDAGLGPSVEQDLAALRRVTASFHDFQTASGAGWSTKITACMTDQGGAGGMGFHYGNTALINGT